MGPDAQRQASTPPSHHLDFVGFVNTDFLRNPIFGRRPLVIKSDLRSAPTQQNRSVLLSYSKPSLMSVVTIHANLGTPRETDGSSDASVRWSHA